MKFNKPNSNSNKFRLLASLCLLILMMSAFIFKQDIAGNLLLFTSKSDLKLAQSTLFKKNSFLLQMAGNDYLELAFVYSTKNKNNDYAILLLDAIDPIELAENGGHFSAIELAVLTNNIDIAKLLIQRGSDVNWRYKESIAVPLHTATRQNNIEMVKLLLEAKANINLKVEKTGTALDIAESKGHIALANFLKSKGAKRAGTNSYRSSASIKN